LVDMEVARCPYCGEQVLEAALEAHWEKKKCVQKAEAEIWKELKVKSIRVPKGLEDTFHIIFEPTSTWRILLDFLKIKKNEKVAWVWIPQDSSKKELKKYLKKIKKLYDQEFVLKWMEEPYDGKRM
jgi:hypothetical protein